MEHSGNTCQSSGTFAGPFPRQRSPISFPVALSESASLSHATSSPERPRRVSHAGRPLDSFSKAATSACATHDTEDTADSGSPQDQYQSSGDSRLQHGLRVSQNGEAGTDRLQMPRPVISGSNDSSSASRVRPRHRESSRKPGAGAQDPSLKPHREKRLSPDFGSPERPSSLDMQKPAAQSADPRVTEGWSMQMDARQEACSGREGSVAQQQQVPALQKLKLRVRSRHRTSSQGSDLPMGLQALELTEGQPLLAAEALQQMAPVPPQLPATDRGTVDGGRAAAGHATVAITGTGTVPAEEQRVFRAVRTLLRSPMKANQEAPPQSAPAQPPSTPAMADAAGSLDRPHSCEDSSAKHAQPQCISDTSAGSHGIRVGEAQADLSPLHQSSINTLSLAPRPQQQPGSPPGSGVLAVNSVLFPAVSKAQQSTAADESAVFTPSHKLARSPPRQLHLLITHEDSASQLTSCSFPEDLEAEELPETPRMRAAARSSPEKHAITCAVFLEARSPAQGSHHW